MWYICVREFWAAHLQPLKPESDLLCVLGEVLGAFLGTAASDGQSQLSLWADALGQLSQDTQARGEVNSAHFSDINMAPNKGCIPGLY